MCHRSTCLDPILLKKAWIWLYTFIFINMQIWPTVSARWRSLAAWADHSTVCLLLKEQNTSQWKPSCQPYSSSQMASYGSTPKTPLSSLTEKKITVHVNDSWSITLEVVRISSLGLFKSWAHCCAVDPNQKFSNITVYFTQYVWWNMKTSYEHINKVEK